MKLEVAEFNPASEDDPPSAAAGPSTVESVRLDPELNDQIAARAAQDGVTASDVIREALRRYLHAS